LATRYKKIQIRMIATHKIPSPWYPINSDMKGLE